MDTVPTKGEPLLVWGYERSDYGGKNPVVREASYHRQDRWEYRRTWFGFFRQVRIVGPYDANLTVGNHAVHFTAKGWMLKSDLLALR
jgi:hypothetical protein